MGSQRIDELLKKAEKVKTENKKQIPLDLVDADNIPREAPLKYEFLCRTVGALYIQHQHSLEVAQERHEAITKELQDQIRELMLQTKRLKEELNKDVSGDVAVPPK